MAFHRCLSLCTIHSLLNSTLRSTRDRTISIHMLCRACQGIFAAQLTVANSTLPDELKIHHSSRRDLKRSIALGCYMCNRFWASLRAADRDSITTLAVRDPVLEEATDGASRRTLADCTTPFVTAYHVEDGPPYGHLGWYQLKIAVNVNAMRTSAMLPSKAGWCDATFVLKPQESEVNQGAGGNCKSENERPNIMHYRLSKQTSHRTSSAKHKLD